MVDDGPTDQIKAQTSNNSKTADPRDQG